LYSDFYEIPLPALRFEKIEEIDIKKTTQVKNDPSKRKPTLRKGTTLSKQRKTTSEKRTTLTTTLSPRQGSQNQNAERTTLKKGVKLFLATF
jgi:hypothetical protein